MLKGNANQLRLLRSKKPNLNVVITGTSRGLGKSLVKEFERYGDNVVSVSRTPSPDTIACDVSSQTCINRIIEEADKRFSGGDIDVWINNAGVSGGMTPFSKMPTHTIDEIITTNLKGTALCARAAYDKMILQPSGGIIYNLAGAGSNGKATKDFAIYGATKAAINQLTLSLQTEWSGTNVNASILSPGLMLTDLLLENLAENEDVFRQVVPFCTEPEIVAFHVVPRIRRAFYYVQEDRPIRFLTLFKIIKKILKQ